MLRKMSQQPGGVLSSLMPCPSATHSYCSVLAFKEADKAGFTWRLQLYKVGEPYREENK